MSQNPNHASSNADRGLRTKLLLVCAMTLATAIITSLFLLFIHRSLRAQATVDLGTDLAQSVVTFRNLQAERFAALDRENSLLASLPTLKALMTSGHEPTIQDGALEYFQLSGNDLFALTGPNGRVLALYTRSHASGVDLRTGLSELVANPSRKNLIDGNVLYACSLQPMYFGDASGTLLGYVISGVSIERTVRQISTATGVEATFLSDDRILTSTFPTDLQPALKFPQNVLAATPVAPTTVSLNGARYLVATESLSDRATAPLQLVLLKSFAPAELWMARVDRIVLTAGIVALLGGSLLMLAIGSLLTRPLEELSNSVRAFAMGDHQHRVPSHGTREVRELSTAFLAMRDEIQQANQSRLEFERLATIGRMASSVSHDLRHYLASVYANAEFLASDTLTPSDRAEIFAEIRSAVLGTADMIESLLMFTRTGSSLRRSPENVATIVEHAIALLRSHPDAQGVTFRTELGDASQTVVFVDASRLERAVYNLLLNACQAGVAPGPSTCVKVTLASSESALTIDVEDNGSGVPESVRARLFEPFVSEGKQKGTGLGLTLVTCIAQEHGGDVVLLESAPGKTIFRLRIALVKPPAESSDEQAGKAVSHETIQG